MHQKPLNTLAFFISAASSPFLVIPLAGLFIIATQTYALVDFILWGALFVLLSTIIPFVFILIGVRLGHFSDIHVMIREQRAEPFMVATLSTLVLAIVFWLIDVPGTLFALSIVMFVNGIVFYLITMYWKISIHAASFAGAVTMAALLVNGYWWWLLLLLPVIIWARWERHRHSVTQGVIAVLVVTIVSAMLLKLVLQYI